MDHAEKYLLAGIAVLILIQLGGAVVTYAACNNLLSVSAENFSCKNVYARLFWATNVFGTDYLPAFIYPLLIAVAVFLFYKTNIATRLLSVLEGAKNNPMLRKNYKVFAVLLFLVLFLAFSMKQRIGDKWDTIAEEADANASYKFWMSSPASSFLIYLVYNLVKGMGISASAAIGYLSILSGIVAVYSLVRISKILGRNEIDSALIFLATAFAGFAAVFYGDVEIIPYAALFTTLYILSALLYLEGKARLLTPLAVFFTGFWFHLSLGWFLPSLLLLPLIKEDKIKYQAGRFVFSLKSLFGKDTLRMLALFVIGSLIVLGLIEVAAYSQYGKHVTELGVGDLLGGSSYVSFAPLFSLGRESYTMFSIPYFMMILNHLYLLSPLALIAVISLLSKPSRLKMDRKAIFLFVMAFFYLIYAFAWEVNASVSDCDLFAPLGPPLSLFAVYALSENHADRGTYRRIMLLIVVVSILLSYPFILRNAELISLEPFLIHR